MAQSLDTTRTRLAYIIQEKVSESTIHDIGNTMSDTDYIVVAIYAPFKSFPNSIGTRCDPLISAYASRGTARSSNNDTTFFNLDNEIKIITEFCTESDAGSLGGNAGDKKISIFIEQSNFKGNDVHGVEISLQFATRVFDAHLIINAYASDAGGADRGIRLNSEHLFQNFNSLDVPVTCRNGSETAVAAYNSIKLAGHGTISSRILFLSGIKTENIPYAFPHFFAFFRGEEQGETYPPTSHISPVSWLFPWDVPNYSPGYQTPTDLSIANFEDRLLLDQLFKTKKHVANLHSWGTRYGTFSAYQPDIPGGVNSCHVPAFWSPLKLEWIDNSSGSITSTPQNLFGGGDVLTLLSGNEAINLTDTLITNTFLNYYIERSDTYDSWTNQSQLEFTEILNSKNKILTYDSAISSSDLSNVLGVFPILNRSHSFFFPRAGQNTEHGGGYLTTCRFLIGENINATNIRNIARGNIYLNSVPTPYAELNISNYSLYGNDGSMSDAGWGSSMASSRLATYLFHDIQTPLSLLDDGAGALQTYGAYNTRYAASNPATGQGTGTELRDFQRNAFQQNVAGTNDAAFNQLGGIQGGGAGNALGSNLSFQDVVVLHNVVGFCDQNSETANPASQVSADVAYAMPTNPYSLAPIFNATLGSYNIFQDANPFLGAEYVSRRSSLNSILPIGGQPLAGNLFLPYIHTTSNIGLCSDLTLNLGRTNQFNGGEENVLGEKHPDTPQGGDPGYSSSNSCFTRYWISNNFSNCFRMVDVSIEVSDATEYSFQNADDLQVKFSIVYQNGCFGSDDYAFKTNAGNKVAVSIAEVLEIFDYITYVPGRASDGSAAWAYEIPILDSTDVLSATVVQLTGSNIYKLEIIFLNDAGDLTQDGSSFPNSDIVPDINFKSYGAGYNSLASDDWSDRRFLVNPDYTTTVDTDINQYKQQSASEIKFGAISGREFRFPFLTYGSIIAQSDGPPEVGVDGCTDSAALNYNAAATVDDGTCDFCDVYIDTNMPATINPLGQVFTTIGNSKFQIELLNPQPVTASGNIIASQDWHQALVNCGSVFSSAPVVLGAVSTAYGSQAGFTADSWKLKLWLLNFDDSDLNSLLTASNFTVKIYPASDERMALIPFEDVASVNDSIISTDSLLSSAGAIYTSTSAQINTGGLTDAYSSIICNVPHTTSGLVSGSSYIIEGKIDMATACSYSGFNTTVYVYGFTWVTYCQCTDVSNLYFPTPYEWSAQDTFPGIFSVSSNPDGNGCTSLNPTIVGSGDTGQICYLADTQLSSCDTYWEWCMTSASTSCIENVSLEELVTTESGIFYPVTSTIVVHITGYYNPTTNTYVYPEDIAYNVLLLDSAGGVIETLTQDDAVPSSGANAVGAFITFNTDYLGNFSIQFQGLNAINPITEDAILGGLCTLNSPTYTIINDTCEVIVGCMDPLSNNLDPNATFSDQTQCEYDPLCEEFITPDITIGVSTVAASTECVSVTEIINGESVTWNYPAVVNDGSVTVTATPVDLAQFGSNIISIGIASQSNIENGGFSTSEIMSFLLENYNTVGGVVSEDIILYWAPGVVIADTADGSSATNVVVTIENLPPGTYYIVATGDIEAQLQWLIDQECLYNAPTIVDSLTQFTIESTDFPDCTEPCAVLPCVDWVLGCTDENATNFNASATLEDGTCEYGFELCEQNPDDPACVECFGEDSLPSPSLKGAASQKNLDDICDPPNTGEGCTDPNSCNYQSDLPLSLSNNQLCDYCSCNSDPYDTDCFPDEGECDPSSDPECQPLVECPDPSNPDCTPDPPTSSCVDDGDCPPPPPPCVFLGNCIEDGDGGVLDGGDTDFDDVLDPVTVNCSLDLGNDETGPNDFQEVQINAFACMADQGKRLLWKLRSGIEHDDTDILKMSLISYLFMGGTERTDIPCLWNCNYDSEDKKRVRDCKSNWESGGGRFWIKKEFFPKGTIVAYLYTVRGKIKRGYFQALIDIVPNSLSPRSPGTGWGRCTDIKVRTKTSNGISDGTEEYLKIMWEYMTRFCTNCSIADSNEIGYPYTIPDETGGENGGSNVPNVSQPGLPIKTINNNPSGILGADGEEIKF